jgi:hypothetical protein
MKGMATEALIPVPTELLEAIRQASPPGLDDSTLVTSALRRFLATILPVATSDADLIARHADELNAEAQDVLAFQVEL